MNSHQHNLNNTRSEELESTEWPSLSILIVNWNSKDYLRKCLLSIELHGEGLASQIVVVDGGSFDGCDTMLADEFPYVEFVQAHENLGFACSNNLGFERVTSEYLLLLNPDTELTPNALKCLLRASLENSQSGIVGPRLLNSDGTLQASCVQPLPTPLNQAFDSDFLRRKLKLTWFLGKDGSMVGDTLTRVPAVSGAAMLMPSDLFRAIGGFDGAYFMYAEDMDLCAKAKRAGRSVLHEPRSLIVHHGEGSSSKTFNKFGVVMNLHALSLFMGRNFGSFATARFKFYILISSLLRIPILNILCIVSSKQRSESIKRWQATASWVLGKEKWCSNYIPAEAGKAELNSALGQ